MPDPPKTGPERPDQRVRASRLKTGKVQVKARILISSGTGPWQPSDSARHDRNGHNTTMPRPWAARAHPTSLTNSDCPAGVNAHLVPESKYIRAAAPTERAPTTRLSICDTPFESLDGTPVSATMNGNILPLAAMTSVTLCENVFAHVEPEFWKYPSRPTTLT